MHAKGLELFLKQGLEHYCEALNAVEFFKEKMIEEMKEFFRERSYPEGFQIDKNKIKPEEGKESPTDAYIQEVIEGNLSKKRVKITAGLWWMPKCLPGKKLIAFANFEEPKRYRNLKLEPDSKGISKKHLEDYNVDVLYIPVISQQSWEKPLGQAIDEVVRLQLKGICGKP
jgi:hypothetical protein